MAIASNGNLTLLGIAPQEKLIKQWELIIQANSKASGDFTYDSYLQLVKSYHQLVSNYTMVKLGLYKIAFVIDYEVVIDLRARGFKISLNDSASYAASIQAGLRKVDSFITRANMKRNEIEAANKEGIATKPVLFEEVLANLCAGLGFNVDDNVTLARFNEYKKIIRNKNKVLSHGRNK